MPLAAAQRQWHQQNRSKHRACRSAAASAAVDTADALLRFDATPFIGPIQVVKIEGEHMAHKGPALVLAPLLLQLLQLSHKQHNSWAAKTADILIQHGISLCHELDHNSREQSWLSSRARCCHAVAWPCSACRGPPADLVVKMLLLLLSLIPKP
jgi:hypothetical protein